MNVWYVIGLAVLVIIVASILISFYFKKKEDFYERLERKTKEQNPPSSGQ